MKKEKFLFELIDNYLYTANLGTLIMENYLLEDRSKDTADCADRLKDCLDFYDQLYEKYDRRIYTEDEIDASLNYLIQILKQETMHRIQGELEKAIENYVGDAKKTLEKYLLFDKDGKPQELNKSTLISFMNQLRKVEII